MDSTVGKLVIGIGADASEARQEMSELKREMRAFSQEKTRIPFYSPEMAEWLAHNKNKAQAMQSYRQDMSRLGLPSAEQALYNVQQQKAKEVEREVRDLKAQALRDYRQQTSGLRYPSAEQALYNVQQQKARAESAEMRDLKRQEMRAYRQQVSMMNLENRSKDKDTREAERLRRNVIMKQNQEWREAQRQQSNAARMDPANNLRRGFVGGMFGSPMGTASTIGTSAMVGAAAGFMGGMAASMVISGIGRIKDAVIGLGVETIKTGSSVELLKLRLDTITKGEGAKYFDELLQTAIDLRSPIEGVITSFSKMTAMGFQPTMDQLKGLVNYTRMLGDPQNLDYIVLAFSQIASKGKLEMQELRQLAERGVPALSIIMEKFKLKPGSIGDIGKLFIPGTKAVKALLEGIKERVGDIGTKWKDTMQSSVDYIKLLWWQFKKEMGDTGMFDSFKSLLKEMTVAMSAPGFKDMAKDIGTAFNVLFKSLEKITNFTKENWVWLGPVLGHFAKSTKLGNVYTIGKLVAQKTGMFAESPWTLTEDDVRRKKKENNPSIDRLMEEQAQLKGFKSQLGEFSVEMELSGWGKKKAELEGSWEKMMKEAATMPGSIAEEAMKAARIARSDSVSKAAKDWITAVMSDVTDSFSSLMDSFGDKQTKDIRKWNEKMDKLIKSLKEGPQTSDAISAIKEAESKKRTGGNLIRDTYLEEFQKDTKQAWKDFYEDLTTINLTGLERQIYDIDKKAQEMLDADIIPDRDIETWRKMKVDQTMRENRPEPTQLSAYVVGTEAANRMQYGGTSQNTFSTIAKNTGETSKEITKLRESIERKRNEPVSGASQDILEAFGL